MIAVLQYYSIAGDPKNAYWVEPVAKWSHFLAKCLFHSRKGVKMACVHSILLECLSSLGAQLSVPTTKAPSPSPTLSSDSYSFENGGNTTNILTTQDIKALIDTELKAHSMVGSALSITTTNGATTHYPTAIRQISLSRPKDLINWDFPTSHTVCDTNARSLDGFKDHNERISAQKAIQKIKMYSIDPASTPAQVIQWVKNIHYQCYTILDKGSLALLYLEACLTNQSYVTGLRSLLSQASVIEVDPHTKYCWVLACFIDHFSQYKFTSAADNLFRTTPLTAGNLLFAEFEAMHQRFLDTRFNDPTPEAKIEIFLPHFKQSLSKQDHDALDMRLDGDSWQSFDAIKAKLKNCQIKHVPPPPVYAILPPSQKGDSEGKDKAKGKRPSSEANQKPVPDHPPHKDCDCDDCVSWFVNTQKAQSRCKSCLKVGCNINKCSNPIARKDIRCSCCGQCNKGPFAKFHAPVCRNKPKFECPRCLSPDHWLAMCPKGRSSSADEPPAKEQRIS